MEQQQALDILLQNIPGKALNEPNFLSFSAGKRKSAWVNNCIGIGLSSGFLEPLESTSIYLIQSAIMKLVELFPERHNMTIKAQELNRYVDMEMQRIRDFLILHYHATSRSDSPFWEYCQNMKVPDSLQQKMALFSEYGVIDTYQHGLFLEPSWLAVYLGQGVIPKHIDPRVTQLQQDKIISTLSKIREQVNLANKGMPTHQQALDFISQDNSVRSRAPSSLNLYGRYPQ